MNEQRRSSSANAKHINKAQLSLCVINVPECRCFHEGSCTTRAAIPTSQTQSTTACFSFCQQNRVLYSLSRSEYERTLLNGDGGYRQ